MARLLDIVCGVLVVVALTNAAPQQAAPSAPAQPQQPQQIGVPNIDWGLCQNLQPSDGERESKKLVIQKCLDGIPIPEGNITAKDADSHREQITTCALRAEGWFNQDGTYKFNRAREEIKTKKLSKEIENSIVQQHDACHKEALEKFAESTVQQIQLYQACMDFHIARICRIQVVVPGQEGQEGQQQGQPGGRQGQDQDYYQ